MEHDVTEHIGPLMKACRAADGIPGAPVMKALGIHDTVELIQFETDVAPPSHQVRLYAAACRDAYVKANARIMRPVAAREQYWTSDLDATMVDHVQRAGRPVAWWWARRTTRGGSGPMCYLCDEFIGTLTVSVGVSDEQREALMNHRWAHLAYYRVTGEFAPVLEADRG